MSLGLALALLSSLPASPAPSAAAALPKQEPTTAPAAVSLEGEARFDEVDGVSVLMWGEHTVLRDLRYFSKGQTLPFDPARVQLEQNGQLLQFRPTSDADRTLVLQATFAVDYAPTIVQSAAPTDGILQYGIGRSASERCDLLIAAQAGLALRAPGSLALDYWLAGGPAELHLKLRQEPTIELQQAPSKQEGLNLDWLKLALLETFKKRELPFPAALEELFIHPLPKGMERRAFAPNAAATLAQPTLINVRVGELPDVPAFDIVLVMNPTDEVLTQRVDFAALGWDKPKRQRIVIQLDDGSSLGVVREGFDLAVPARGYAMATLRAPMPRGLIANSDGPLAPLLRPWTFESLTAAQSGVVDFWSTWKVATPNAEGGWAVFSVADGRDAPFRVGVAEDEQENGLVFRQQDALLFLELPAVQAAEWLVRLHFDGRVDG